MRTTRLLLRAWRADDAPSLQPVLEANWPHLAPWIPARVATPVPVPQLAERLAGFAADFVADREWRYAVFGLADAKLLGEIGLYPRSTTDRVPYSRADRVELGYWLRADQTGRGFITEAAWQLLAAAARLPRLAVAEIRCDARNVPSAAVPRRLGFALETTLTEPARKSGETPIELQVWRASLEQFARS